jgi:hypothetical protein
MKEPLVEEGFTAHEIEQARAWQKLSPWDRLAWLAQAKEFAALALASAARRRAHECLEGSNE